MFIYINVIYIYIIGQLIILYVYIHICSICTVYIQYIYIYVYTVYIYTDLKIWHVTRSHGLQMMGLDSLETMLLTFTLIFDKICYLYDL